MPDSLRDEVLTLTEQFRHALAGGNYDQAHALLARQRQYLEKHRDSPEFTHPEGIALVRQMLELLEWARLVAVTARADALTELNQIRHSALYRVASPAPRQTWQLTA
jgi:hypothetical protein